MDLHLEDAAAVEQQLEERVDAGTEDDEESDEGEDGAPRKRGKDIPYKELAAFSCKEEMEASELHLEITTQFERKRTHNSEECRTEFHYCRHYNKKGWERCPRILRVVFAHTSKDIFVSENEDHRHQVKEAQGAGSKYMWTKAQEDLIRLFLKSKTKSNQLILREMRAQNMVNAAGKLPTAAQVTFAIGHFLHLSDFLLIQFLFRLAQKRGICEIIPSQKLTSWMFSN